MSTLQALIARLPPLDVIDSLRAFFIFAACTTLTISVPESFRARFVTYGARATPPADSKLSQSESSTSTSESAQTGSLATRTLDCLASLRVPHSYFTQFYVASVLALVFWVAQLLFGGYVFRAITARVSAEHLASSMSVHQVVTCWALMMIQGCRRLYECLVFSKPSSSQMWFVHWLLGVVFYLTATIAIWIEGTGALISYEFALDDINVASSPPTLRTIICIPIFLIASGLQHDCHHYLFSLEKYTLPIHPLFNSIVCPHYTAECAIYLSLALLGAPQGEQVNKSLLSCLAFVTVNLGITAASSKQWYRAKFGEDAVRGKWKMIPWIY